MANFLTLAVGGGGGSGGGTINTSKSGGGGGGQVLDAASTSLTSGVSYAITIGAAGTHGDTTGTAGSPGGTTSIGSVVTALGGGGGAGFNGSGTNPNPTSGSGNGGAGSGWNNGSTSGATGVQHNGGNGFAASGNASASGGGGGAGGAGGGASSNTGGNAGIGLASTISGSSLNYGCGGIGIGANASGTPASGTDYGRGGDGAGNTGANAYNGNDGHSGIVVIAFPTGSNWAVTDSTNAVHTTVGGNEIYTWAASGSFSFSVPLAASVSDSTAVSDVPSLIIIDRSLGLIQESSAVSDSPTMAEVNYAAPLVSFRRATSPYDVLTSVSFVQTAPDGYVLPVKEGETSDIVHFRIYNNFGLAPLIGVMNNVKVTAFGDPQSQAWVKIYETGYGEGAATPGLYTQFSDEPTAVGNSGESTYTPPLGSDGGTTPRIRAGTDGNGCGFVEFAAYLQVPEGANFDDYTFTFGVEYN